MRIDNLLTPGTKVEIPMASSTDLSGSDNTKNLAEFIMEMQEAIVELQEAVTPTP